MGMLRRDIARKGGRATPAELLPCVALAFAALLSSGAQAQTGGKPAAPKNDAPADQHILGDWRGLRSDLHNDGVDLSVDYTGQVAANLAGGKRTGVDYAQQVQFKADVDWSVLAGAKGFSTHVILVNRAGRNLGTDHVGDNLFQPQSVYGGAGDVLIHLVEAYGEEKLADGRVDVAAGRLPVGEDFATSPLYCDFLNTAVCGYPHSLPAKVGFTAFPNSTWGARARIAPAKHLYVQTGAYQVRPQFGGRAGFDWGWSGTTGTYFPLEVGYEPVLGASRLPGHYKLGLAHDTSDYPDVLRDAAGRAFVLSGAPPAQHGGRNSAYLLADQMVHRSGKGPTDGLILMGGYVRSDRDTSQFSRFAFLGAIAPSPLASRPHDNIGAVVAWAKIGDPLAETEALQAAAGLPLLDHAVGVQSDETIAEVRYEIALSKGLSLTPDIQYIVHPGAARTYPNATVIGLQVEADF
jgi:porin